VFTEKCRDLDLLALSLLSDGPAVLVELPVRPLGTAGVMRNPWSACFNCTPRGGIIERMVARLLLRRRLARTQSEANVGGETLE
jgi:hypothetical protein